MVKSKIKTNEKPETKKPAAKPGPSASKASNESPSHNTSTGAGRSIEREQVSDPKLDAKGKKRKIKAKPPGKLATVNQAAQNDDDDDMEYEEISPGPAKERHLIFRNAGTSKNPWTVPKQVSLPSSTSESRDEFANLSTWVTSSTITLTTANVRSLYTPKGWLTTAVVNAACFMVFNEFVANSFANHVADTLFLVPSNTWMTYAKSVARAEFLHKPQPLNTKYIAFVMNETDDHWFLVIIANPKGVIKGAEGSPVVMLFDSLCNNYKELTRGVYARIAVELKHFLFALAKDSIPPESVKPAISLKMKVAQNTPQQSNTYDCGLYPAFFLRCFLNAMDEFETIYTTKDGPSVTIDNKLWLPELQQALRPRLQMEITMLYEQAYRPSDT